jgi:DNA-binding NarL/FixJ family response regulator
VAQEAAAEERIRVAVVDDHPVVRAGIVAFLKKSGSCRVVCEADSAASALRLLSKVHPDVVVLDLKLPDSRGSALVGELGRIIPDSKLLVLTAYEEVGIAREALQLGARGYLLKGAPGQALLSAISEVAAGHRVIDPALAGQLWDLQVEPTAPTDREVEILRLLADGRTNKEIAVVLCISQETVKFHLKNIYRRLDARTRTEAVVAATRLGYLKIGP